MTVALIGVFIACVLTIASRGVPRVFFPKPLGSDVAFHLRRAQRIADNGFRLPESDNRILYSNSETYPFIYHFLLAHFRGGRFAAERLTGAVADGMQVALAGFLAWYLHAVLDLPEAGRGWTAVSAAFLTAFAPSFVAALAGPRAYTGSPRVFGQLLFTIACAGMILAEVDGAPLWLVATVLSVGILVVTSKFANQHLMATAAGLLVAGAWSALAAILAGILLCVLLWRERALDVIRGQIAHSFTYYTRLQKPFLFGHRPSMRMWATQMIDAAKIGIRSPVRGLIYLVRLDYWPHRFLVLFATFPVACAALYALPLSSSVRVVLAGLLGSAFIASVLTAQRSLSFLGEWHRYLEHTVAVQSVLAAFLLSNLYPPLIVLFVLYGLFFYVNSLHVFSQQYLALSEDTDNLSELLRPIDRSSSRVFVLGAMFWPVLRATRELKLHCYNGNIDLRRFRGESFQDLFGNFPSPGRPFKELAPVYGIDYVVGRVEDFKKYVRTLDDPALETLMLERQCGNFQLYRTVATCEGTISISANPY